MIQWDYRRSRSYLGKWILHMFKVRDSSKRSASSWRQIYRHIEVIENSWLGMDLGIPSSSYRSRIIGCVVSSTTLNAEFHSLMIRYVYIFMMIVRLDKYGQRVSPSFCSIWTQTRWSTTYSTLRGGKDGKKIDQCLSGPLRWEIYSSTLML